LTFLGASLVSIEDSAEMNFLLLYLSPLASDFRKFWIGLFKNFDGNYFIIHTETKINTK